MIPDQTAEEERTPEVCPSSNYKPPWLLEEKGESGCTFDTLVRNRAMANKMIYQLPEIKSFGHLAFVPCVGGVFIVELCHCLFNCSKIVGGKSAGNTEFFLPPRERARESG